LGLRRRASPNGADVRTHSPGKDRGGAWVNDVHSLLNCTRVSRIFSPRSVEELTALVRDSNGGPLAVSGGRHAMGGQQFAQDATLVDMSALKRVLHFDRVNGIVEVGAGMQWPELIGYLTTAQSDRWPQWAIVQKQTGADSLSLGGALSANIHGRGLRMRPIVSNVESFVLVDAAGNVRECSREKNNRLFRLAIGGYGLFGFIASVKLRLVQRRQVVRVVKVLRTFELMTAFEQRIADGFLYGDFQFSIDERSSDFLREGVFSCYVPAKRLRAVPRRQRVLSSDDWQRLLWLAHADRARAYAEYKRHYLATSGQWYWSDTHQLSTYVENYHRAIDRRSGARPCGSEVITELYVPRGRLHDFMEGAREQFLRDQTVVIYGTVRLIERDEETFLAWANKNYACIVFNLHVAHAPEGRREIRAATRRLIDLAIRLGGNFYLTYDRAATREQVEHCYPQFAEFLRCKKACDPAGRFQSDWYRHYAKMWEPALPGQCRERRTLAKLTC
jgi:FAD/FMN-containing dehydrogenase